MNNRTDPSSLSFGRLLRQTAQTVQVQQREIEDLKNSKIDPAVTQSAKEMAAERKAERRRATQVLADYSSTAEDYASLNQSLLTSAHREQIRHNMNALTAAQFKPAVQFDDAAITRINNWRSFVKQNGTDLFQQNNAQPEPARRPFDLWKERQDSPAGRMHNARIQRNEMERMKSDAKSKVKPKRSAGRTIGKQKPTEK